MKIICRKLKLKNKIQMKNGKELCLIKSYQSNKNTNKCLTKQHICRIKLKLNKI